MSEPIVEQIAAALKTRIESVTVTNGYQETVSEVVRPSRASGEQAYVPQNNLVVILQDDPEEGDSPEGLKAWIQPFALMAFAQLSDQASTPADTVLNRFAADLEKAIRSDPTFGGLAYDAVIRPAFGWVGKNAFTGFEGITVNVDIYYRTLEDDPYAAG